MNKEYNSSDYYVQLQFRDEQLQIIRQWYLRDLAPRLRNFKYLGQPVTIDWGQNGGEVPYDATDTISAIKLPDLINDPMWETYFGDILPYMNLDGSLSIMPPFTIMVPHLDRPYRACPIYFPITGCSQYVYSDIYDLPKDREHRVRPVESRVVPPIFTYSVADNAYLMDNQEWHGVRNYSKQTRIAFGWNTKGDDFRKSFTELKEIFKSLGYLAE